MHSHAVLLDDLLFRRDRASARSSATYRVSPVRLILQVSSGCASTGESSSLCGLARPFLRFIREIGDLLIVPIVSIARCGSQNFGKPLKKKRESSLGFVARLRAI